MKKYLLPFCLLAISAGHQLYGQQPTVAAMPETLFQKGKEMYDVKNWDGCIDQLSRYKETSLKSFVPQQANFGAWSSRFDRNSTLQDRDLVQEADYMIAVAAFEKGKEYALELLQEFRTVYPDSPHRQEVDFLIGSRYFLNESYPAAIRSFEEVDIDHLPLHLQPAFFHRLGICYLKTDRIDDARPLFEVLASFDSEYRDAAAYYQAYLLYADKKYTASLQAFQSLPEATEYSATVPYYITQIYFLQGKHQEAAKRAIGLLKEDYLEAEQEAELSRIAGTCLYESGNNSRALPYFKQYLSTTSAPIRSSALLGGICAYQGGDFALAIQSLSKATGISDELEQRAYLYLGHAYLQNGDMRNARMAFETAAKTDFDQKVKEDAWYNYGLTVHESSYSPFNESVVVFEEFLNRFPNSVYTDKVNDCLVEVYMTTRNYEAALNSINKIARPGHKILIAKQRVLFQLGTQQVANARLKEAEHYFSEAIRLGNLNQETRAQAFFWRGECAYRDARFPQAESDFRQFLSLSQNTRSEIYALGNYNLAYACFKQQKFAPAIDWFDKYVAIPSEHGKNTYADAMNRMGDAFFYTRRFEKAESCYTKAAGVAGGMGDYAMFQKGFMAGLQKDYAGKVNSMKQLLKAWPDSEYADDALFEQGKTFVTMGNTAEAITAYHHLINRFPNSSFARQAGVQLGLVYFNLNESEKAIEAYKKVVANYPGSEEARVAVEDLKTVYIELNDIPAYASYIATLKGKVQFAAGEQDSLTYMAAEKVLMRGNSSQSKQALINYLQSFEQGAFRLSAQTELGRIYYAEKAFAEAQNAYETILQQPDNKFTEEALARTAEIYFMDGESRKALDRFRNLLVRAERKENKDAARIGILRTTVSLELHEEVVLAANELLENKAVLSPELRNEALYNRAKSLLVLKKADYAVKDLKVLAKDTRSVFGAEASFLLADLYFQQNELDKAEKEVFALIDSATPHQYWLARGFILLADIYLKKGDTFQAKQYLQSLQNNYAAQDEISEMIELRFKKIGEQNEKSL